MEHENEIQSERVSENERTEASVEREAQVERIVSAVSGLAGVGLDVGRAWASYGLRVGKLAVETHAHVLSRVADALSEWNDVIAPRADEAARPSEGAASEREPSMERA